MRHGHDTQNVLLIILKFQVNCREVVNLTFYNKSCVAK